MRSPLDPAPRHSQSINLIVCVHELQKQWALGADRLFPEEQRPCAQEVFRKAAVKAVSGRLTAAIAAANAQTAKETDELFQEQTELGHRQRELDKGIQALQVSTPTHHELTYLVVLPGRKLASLF